MPDVSLSLIVLKTPQLESLKFFYETIGVEFTQEQHGSGPTHFAGKVGQTLLEIYPLQGDAADATTRLGFVVDDLGFVLESLWRSELSPLKKGKPTDWGLRAVVKDPDGRSIELYQGTCQP